jgi:hypothetical protein
MHRTTRKESEMKSTFAFLSILLMATTILSACAGEPASAQSYGTEEFLADLASQGVKAEKGDELEQAFFSVTGNHVNLDAESVQLFEYDSASTMESDAVLVDASGSSIGPSMVSWIATPHFYKKGRILVLYVGEAAQTLELLEGVLGQQFAGG